VTLAATAAPPILVVALQLHTRSLEFRAVRVPVQGAALALTLGALGGGILLLFLPAPAVLRRALFLAGVAAASIPIVLVPVGYLPSFSYALLVPVMIALTAAATAVAWWLGRGEPTGPFVVVARLGLVALLIEALTGWRGMHFAFLGGSAIEGSRFYGLTNPYAGVLLAAGILSATRLPVPWGTGLLVACAAFAGAPGLGADLGGGVTLAAAAGLWLGVRSRERLDLGALAYGVAAAFAGLLLLLAWHGFAAAEPTHVTRVVEEAGRTGVGALVGAAGRRLKILVENTSRTPVLWPAVAGLPAVLAVALRRAGPFRTLLQRDPAWRWGLVVLAISGMVGFVANDTSSTAAVAMAYVSLALVFPSLEGRWAKSS
jgi:hypothetical protein